MKQVKIGIIGVGNMGSAHLNNILSGKCPELQVSAVADIDPARLQWVKEKAALWKRRSSRCRITIIPATPLPAWREGFTSWWKSPRACTPNRCGK